MSNPFTARMNSPKSKANICDGPSTNTEMAISGYSAPIMNTAIPPFVVCRNNRGIDNNTTMEKEQKVTIPSEEPIYVKIGNRSRACGPLILSTVRFERLIAFEYNTNGDDGLEQPARMEMVFTMNMACSGDLNATWVMMDISTGTLFIWLRWKNNVTSRKKNWKKDR